MKLKVRNHQRAHQGSFGPVPLNSDVGIKRLLLIKTNNSSIAQHAASTVTLRLLTPHPCIHIKASADNCTFTIIPTALSSPQHLVRSTVGVRRGASACVIFLLSRQIIQKKKQTGSDANRLFHEPASEAARQDTGCPGDARLSVCQPRGNPHRWLCRPGNPLRWSISCLTALLMG